MTPNCSSTASKIWAVAEQRALVAPLDVKCGNIDQLKDKKERAFALLKERRNAMISAVVTVKINGTKK